MGLTTGVMVQAFDLSAVHKGDAIRVRRLGDTTYRNGIITRLTESSMTILYSNVQNNATSFLDICAADAAGGVWDVYWTTDFITVNYNAGSGANV